MNLRETLDAAEARLDAELAPLREQVGVLEAELRDVKRAKAALDGTLVVRRNRTSSRHTIKEMALHVLQVNFDADGATTAELAAEIQIVFERSVKRECLSPQLSRLVDSGDLIHEGKRWLLTPRAAASKLPPPAPSAPGSSEGGK